MIFSILRTFTVYLCTLTSLQGCNVLTDNGKEPCGIAVLGLDATKNNRVNHYRSFSSPLLEIGDLKMTLSMHFLHLSEVTAGHRGSSLSTGSGLPHSPPTAHDHRWGWERRFTVDAILPETENNSLRPRGADFYPAASHFGVNKPRTCWRLWFDEAKEDRWKKVCLILLSDVLWTCPL